jgi:predicted membrane GTPase involved in stress response
MAVHPISVLVTHSSATSQRLFALDALGKVMSSDKVSAEISDEGLIVRGLGELDLEEAVFRLGQVFAGIVCSKPQVAYIEGPELREPVYTATIDTPEDFCGTVLADMSARRALITAISDSKLGKLITAEVPVCECFGYDTVLRALTRGKGTYVIRYSCYWKPGRYGRGTEID